jgi:hypothetical protein
MSNGGDQGTQAPAWTRVKWGIKSYFEEQAELKENSN